MTIVKLNLLTNAFDQENTFSFAYKSHDYPKQRTATGYLQWSGGELVLFKSANCLKSTYTQLDREENLRLQTMSPIQDNQMVEVDGKKYTVKIFGNYSVAGRLLPIPIEV